MTARAHAKLALGLVPVALSVTFAPACGEAGANAPRPAASTVIDEFSGRYRGVGIGDGKEKMFETFGAKTAATDNEPVNPLDDHTEIYYGPWILDVDPDPEDPNPPPQPTYRYRKATFILFKDRISALVVVDASARTRRGVGIGSKIDDVEKAYPELTCGTANEGNSEASQFRACEGKTAPGRWIWFGGDPVRNITLANVMFHGL
jgi:hypothetical protein